MPQARRRPVLGALAVWAAVLAGAGAAGLYSSHSVAPQTAALEQVSSDWAVQGGSITIAITQFGATVQGSFSDWTADITFDPAITDGASGSVEVVISTGSLTIGSVTAQALGADFFAASTFPTAVFQADLITTAGGHNAIGTLTIRDTVLPVQMPFTLTVDGDTAQMQAGLTLDRRDFGIGAGMTDESALAFDVGVAVTLTATRAATQ